VPLGSLPGPHSAAVVCHGRFFVDLVVVWSRISNALKRLGFRYRIFLAQLVSEASRARTIRVRRSSLGRPWNALGAPARVCQRNSRSRAPAAKRISGDGEPDPERADQGSAAAFGRRKSNTGGDRLTCGFAKMIDIGREELKNQRHPYRRESLGRHVSCARGLRSPTNPRDDVNQASNFVLGSVSTEAHRGPT
jgi:hypothetical protein